MIRMLIKICQFRTFSDKNLLKKCFRTENISKIQKKVTNCLVVSDKSVTFAVVILTIKIIRQ